MTAHFSPSNEGAKQEVHRCRREMERCEAYLNDPALLAEWCRLYHATEEQARLGAFLGVLDWQAEAWLIERENLGDKTPC